MSLQIIKGVQKRPQRVVIYGIEGIGKSTLAAQFPKPLFIDTEGGTAHMNVDLLPTPATWEELTELLHLIPRSDELDEYRTLVIDTIDWAEMLCIDFVCVKAGKSGIEDFGYGTGYTAVKEEFERMIRKLDEIVAAGKNVVLVAHAQLRKFEQPDASGAYDRYELKLGKRTASQTAPIIKEWSDMLLFINYKTEVYKDGNKYKATGGERTVFTTHSPAYDAKNRHELPSSFPLSYEPLEGVIPGGEKREIHPKLHELMTANGYTAQDVQQAVAKAGYYAATKKVEMYPIEFVERKLLKNWDGVKQVIDAAKKADRKDV